MGEIVDLFAGPGGWSEALRLLGRSADEIGIEYEPNACKTRTAAGHRTLQADVSTIQEQDYNEIEGLIASPPCQGFSSAGKGAARDLIPELLASIRARRWTDRADPDPRVWLIVDLGRWLERLTPEWVALEQVPAVLPIWRTYAEMLRDRGYSVWTGILNAADFGVPQTRQRAVLVASRVRDVHPPEPTHAEVPTAGLFGTLEPWVTMAEALGWGITDRPAHAVAPGTKSGGGSSYGGGSGSRRSAERAREEGRWIGATRGDSRRPGDSYDASAKPSRTMTSKSDSWRFTQEGSDDAPIKLTPTEALTLQSFRPDYPVQGSKTKQFEQIGNAIPPLLARRVLEAVLPSRVRQDHT